MIDNQPIEGVDDAGYTGKGLAPQPRVPITSWTAEQVQARRELRRYLPRWSELPAERRRWLAAWFDARLRVVAPDLDSYDGSDDRLRVIAEENGVTYAWLHGIHTPSRQPQRRRALLNELPIPMEVGRSGRLVERPEVRQAWHEWIKTLDLKVQQELRRDDPGRDRFGISQRGTFPVAPRIQNREGDFGDNPLFEEGNGIWPSRTPDQLALEQGMRPFLERLTPREREAIQLKLDERLTDRDAGERMGISHVRIKQLVKRGRERLWADLLAEFGDD